LMLVSKLFLVLATRHKQWMQDQHQQRRQQN